MARNFLFLFFFLDRREVVGIGCCTSLPSAARDVTLSSFLEQEPSGLKGFAVVGGSFLPAPCLPLLLLVRMATMPPPLLRVFAGGAGGDSNVVGEGANKTIPGFE